MKISIVTACFNAENTIEKTIRSVIEQKYYDLEFILIDGSSKDNTMNIVKKYEDKFSYIVSEKDRGVADGFNKGIKAATGDLILILNADDELYPDALKYIEDAYDPSIGIYYGDCVVIDDKNRTECYQKASNIEKMEYCLPCSHQSIYISKSCYEKYGFYSLEYKLCTDYELIIKMYKGGETFKYIPYPLCRYRQGGCTYVNPYATIKENMKIAVENGLKKSKAFEYSVYYLSLCYGKRICEQLNILPFARKVRQHINKKVSYKG